MPESRCAAHRALATHHCDGCGELLCQECIDVGHRLLTCKSCGEMALPLADQGPANAAELARARTRARPYGTREALRFALRGQGIYVGVGAVLYLCLLRGLGFMAPFAGLGAIPLFLLILFLSLLFALLAAGISFAIVRSTAEGGDEMPDWPDMSEFGERVSELLAAIVLGLFAALPAIALVWMTDCAAGLLTFDVSCWLTLALGLLLGLPVWVPSFGAVGLFGNPWLAVRWDLHVRALLATWPGAIRISSALVALHLVAGLVGAVLAVLPLVGWLAALAIDVYAWFTGVHFIGLLMREHEGDLEAIYYR